VRPLRRLLSRLQGLSTRRRRERDFDEELQSHVDMHTDDGIRAGLSPQEARRRALVMLGGAQQTRDNYTDGLTLPSVESVLQDVRFAVRIMAKSPGFTAVAVLVLALGIGANAAVFSLINALLLRPLNGTTTSTPMGVFVGDRTRPDAWRFFSYPEYTDLRQQSELFTSVVAETGSHHPGLDENGPTRRISARVVSSNYFSALGGRMAAGRGFTAAEEHPNAGTAVAVVSYPFWRRRGLDPALVGSTLTINGKPFTVVGVGPDGFTGLMPVTSPDVWLPFGAAALVASSSSPTSLGRVSLDRDVQSLLVTAFLRDGVTTVSAMGRLDSLAAGMPPAVTGGRAHLVVAPRSRTAMGVGPGRDTNARAGATVLMALTMLVLVVACLNLANMLLARGSVRRPEIAVRLALGGSRARLIRQLMTEGALLSLLGGATALLVAWVAARQVMATVDGISGSNAVVDLTPDLRVFGTVAVACVVSTLAFSLGPAWTLSKPDLSSGLKTAGLRGTRRRVPIPDLLVGAQVALSLALLVAAGLFLRAGAAAAIADPGYTLRDGLLVQTDMDMIDASRSDGLRLYGQLVDRLRAMPGVRAATLASIVPFGSARDGRMVSHDSNLIFATYTVIGSGYLDTLGLKLLSGRDFTRIEEQTDAASPVALVDQALVDQLFAGRNPIGQRLHMSIRPDRSDEEAVEIVGVVPTVRDDIAEGVNAHVYVPFGSRYRPAMTLRVKTEAGAETALTLPLRAAIAEIDRRVPVLSIQTLSQHRDASETILGLTIVSVIFGAIGAIALFLASVGVYGLRAYLVAQRTREFAIRLALGAPRGLVLRQVLGEGSRVAATGSAIGALLAAGVTIVLQQVGMLIGVSPTDPLVLIGAPLVLLAAIGLASYIPARRALRVEPVTALRVE
jgi:putative ABC transport system permease protein